MKRKDREIIKGISSGKIAGKGEKALRLLRVSLRAVAVKKTLGIAERRLGVSFFRAPAKKLSRARVIPF